MTEVATPRDPATGAAAPATLRELTGPSHPPANRSRLGQLRRAAHHFRLGEYADVIDLLEAEPGNGGEVGRGILLTARGMVLHGDGRSDEAAPLMEEALSLIVPVPVVLEAIAEFFASHEQPMLAHYAFLMADVYAPLSMARFEKRQVGTDRVRYAPWDLRASSTARREDLYGMGARKAELRDRLGPAGAAMVLGTMTGTPGSHRAMERPLRRLVDHAGATGREFEEISPARTVTYSAPNLVGGSPQAAHERTTRPFFTCILDDVVVSAKSDVLLTADVALVDLVGELNERMLFDADPMVAAIEPEAVYVAEPARPDDLPYVPEALWLSGRDSRAFGNWMVDYLPRVWAFMDRPGFADLPIIVDDGMPAQLEEALRFFIGRSNPLIRLDRGEHVRVGALWVASGIFQRETVDVDSWLQLLERAQPALERVDSSGAPERIYLTRKPIQHRKLVNAEAIEEMVVQRGYEVYDFAEVPFAEQVRLIRGARHVLGPDGSAFLTTFLGRPGLHTSKFSQPFVEEIVGYAHVSEALQQHLAVLVGDLETEHPRYKRMSDYSIDLAQLVSHLDDVDRQLAASSAPATDPVG